MPEREQKHFSNNYDSCLHLSALLAAQGARENDDNTTPPPKATAPTTENVQFVLHFDNDCHHLEAAVPMLKVCTQRHIDNTQGFFSTFDL